VTSMSTSTSTSTSTGKQAVANAEALLGRFLRERADLIERKAALADKRRTVAYDAHAGDGSASWISTVAANPGHRDGG
jgi:hypothetical protein